MNHYSILAVVLLDEPITAPLVRGPIEGYTRTFWVNATSYAEAVGVVEGELAGLRIPSVECMALDEDDIARAALPGDADLETPGIFHRFDESFFGPAGSGRRWWQFWR